jgi:anti-sigma regulatory factor (Ser/Thr protein kinase)
MPAQPPAANVAFRLQARPASAVLLRHRLEEWLRDQDVPEPDCFDILLAASEAFANAVEHPLRPAAGVVDIEAEIRDGVLELTIRDYGAWRDRREREEGGLGFPIMRSVMQGVEVDSQSEGSTITLRQRLPSSSG